MEKENITETGLEAYMVGPYSVYNNTGYQIKVCYMQNASVVDSPWQIQNPMVLYLPYLVIQLALMILLTRVLMFILKPLRQPRFVAEVLAGVMLGPTAFGKLKLSSMIFPFESNLVLETFASLGLTYYMFLVGLEMDLSALRHVKKKTLCIAMTGILIPLGTGAGLYNYDLLEGVDRKLRAKGAAFWAITLSISSFPDLARILSDIKLLHNELGRTALTSALISDISAWVLLIVAITMSGQANFIEVNKLYTAALPTTIFLLICWFLLRPGIAWVISQTQKKGEKFGETHISFILTAVAVCGFTADACGSHSMLGGFMLGLMIPNGELGIEVMERVEEFVNGIMLPAFLLLNGFRTNFRDIRGKTNMVRLWQISFLATSSKIVSTLVVSLCFGMPLRDGLTLGALLNTKGVLALIVLNQGRSLQGMDNITMLAMVLIVLFMTASVGPILFIISKTTKRGMMKYKRRTIQRSKPETELGILTCIDSSKRLSGIINLLQHSNPTIKSPISVFFVHLVELTGSAASAMLIVHDTSKFSSSNNMSREKAESEQIIGALAQYKAINKYVTVHPLTAVSPYTTMHEDIFNLAEDKRVAMILIPFHRQLKADYVEFELQGERHSIRDVNQKLLVNAPCSVGILVDRGLRFSVRSILRTAMLFIGGADDHEALSYAWRMAGSPNVTLTVIRFLPGKDAAEELNTMITENAQNDASKEIEIARELDDELMNDFRFKTMCDPSVACHERLVNSSIEIVESVKKMCEDFDLYIVGRGQGVKSPLTKGLSEWNDNPELGPMGETLVSSESTSRASVLVVQQSASASGHKPKSSRKKWASPVLNPDYEAFVNRQDMD